MIAEFYCDQCKVNNTIELLIGLEGLHIIVCGNCNHKHYRIVRDGESSDLRFPERAVEQFRLKTYEYKGKWREKSWEKDQFLSPLWAKQMS